MVAWWWMLVSAAMGAAFATVVIGLFDFAPFGRGNAVGGVED